MTWRRRAALAAFGLTAGCATASPILAPARVLPAEKVELDLGTTVRLNVDSDINETMRMPFPVRQRTSTASLRIAPSPSITLILGAERRSMAGENLIRAGATIFVHGRTWHIGAGFQAGQDRPMKGAALSVF